MKTLTTILLLALASSAMAAETDSKANAERHVADDLVNVTLPTGEAVMRLVSRNRISARQFWIGSVYGNQQSIVVFQGGSAITPGYTDTPIAQKGERRIEQAPSDPIGFMTLAAERQ
jgi:hypothetical protein